MEVQKALCVKWRMGIHIRPATKISKLSREFSSNIQLSKGDTTCNAKSLLELLTLAACLNETILLSAQGEDAELAVEAITRFFEEYKDNEDDGIGHPF